MNDQTSAPQPPVDENSLIAEHRAKLTALRQQGIAYPNDFRCSAGLCCTPAPHYDRPRP